MNKIEFDDFSEEYNDLLQSQHEKLGDISYYSKYKIDILEKQFNSIQNLNILEFGCGIGRNLPFLSKAFKKSAIYGFDISKESIKIAKKNNPNVEFLQKKSLIDYHEYFDLIFIAGVYHHIAIEQRDEVSKSIYKLLKKNAKVIIFEHNPYNPITMKLVNTCIFDEDAIVLKKNELIEIFLKNRFMLVDSKYCLFFPPRLSKFNFIENFLFWCPLGGQYYVIVEK